MEKERKRVLILKEKRDDFRRPNKVHFSVHGLDNVNKQSQPHLIKLLDPLYMEMKEHGLSTTIEVFQK